MSTNSKWPADFSHVSDETLAKAQRVFEEFYPRCFWFMRPDLRVTREVLGSIIKELQLNGGHRGFKLAAELCH